MQLYNQIYNVNDNYNTHPKHVLNLVAQYTRDITKCPYNVLEYAPKREKAIVPACGMFGIAYDVISNMNPLNSSYVLGGNEVIVDHFVNECGQLLGSIEYFESKNKTQAKGCQEVSTYYDQLFKTLDKSKLFGAMINDLQYWSNKHNFDLDMAHIGALFKSSKSERIAFLTKRDLKK